MQSREDTCPRSTSLNHSLQLVRPSLSLIPPRSFLPTGWITAMFSLGCIIGSLPSGFLTDFMGRKRCIIFLSFVFTVGAVIQLVPSGYQMLLAGRFISGVGRFGRRHGRERRGSGGAGFLYLLACSFSGAQGVVCVDVLPSEMTKRRSNSLGAPPVLTASRPPSPSASPPTPFFSRCGRTVHGSYSLPVRDRAPQGEPTSHSTFLLPSFPPSLPNFLPAPPLPTFSSSEVFPPSHAPFLPSSSSRFEAWWSRSSSSPSRPASYWPGA